MTSTLNRGLLAGAAGTAVLNAISYADLAARGRDASDLPGRTVERLGDVIGVSIPGAPAERSHRLTALGALAGTATGLAVGVVAAAARSAGVRLPAPLEAVAVGAGAMVATDGPAALLGLTEPRTWSVTDWISDAGPHLGYGIGVVSVLRATSSTEDDVEPASAGLLLRSVALGAAAGCRSSLGVAAPTLRSGASGISRAAALATVAGEMVADKLPSTPARTQPQGAAPRFAAAVTGATALSRRQNRNVVLPAVAAAAGAALGTWGGHAWRAWAADRMPAWQAALMEDVVAASVALLASGGAGSVATEQ
ncbi:hypothetical protein GCM10022223_07470 [Kineosporia mesophila]|uniref:DUF4126 domain-containing protein n=1 Tax=Kineosporia mesophila TaxID=566012 RepID=A0ABP6Z0V2_9ACTN|nr:hypothetical protein [Kineosporia mesophila]MCD5351127.1 hypothetical protein [Kineosporia mesophila]